MLLLGGEKPDWCESGFITKSGCCSKALSDADIMADDWEIVDE